jgi:hemoglobin-like flavoprotein
MITGKLPREGNARLPSAPESPDHFAVLEDLRCCEGGFLCPAPLAATLDRMAAVDPADRFDDLGHALCYLSQFGNESLAIAKESYRRVVSLENWKSKVFGSFYDRFTAQCSSARVKEMFHGIDWNRQYEMLTEAVLLLLAFCEFDASESNEPTVLSRVAARHAKFDLLPGDFNLFQRLLIDAFVESDPNCVSNPSISREVTRAWRLSLQPGIDYMKHFRP